jgi:hypothetical protein
VRQIWVFENRPEILCKLAARLGKGGRRLSFCYEAGPCGYGLHRLLTGRGHSCIVVAPSLIPMKSGDRVKTDRRDAVLLAKLHRAGELTAIWIPNAAHEAMRDLVRARATAGRVLARARQHLQGFLLRHDRIYRAARAWTLAYRRWLTTVRFEHPAQQIVLQDYIHAVEDAEARRDRLSRQIEELLPSWSMAPVVKALQAMRGVALVGRVEASLTAWIETHRGLEMLYRQVCLTGEQTQPTTPIPALGKARIERESPIDQGQSGIDVLAEMPEHQGGTAENPGVVGGGAKCPPSEIDGHLAVLPLLAIIVPIEIFKIDPVGGRQCQSKAVARFARSSLLDQLDPVGEVGPLVGRSSRASAQKQIVGAACSRRTLGPGTGA